MSKQTDQPPFVVTRRPRRYERYADGPVDGVTIYAWQAPDRPHPVGILWTNGDDALAFAEVPDPRSNAMAAWWRQTLDLAYARGTSAADCFAHWRDTNGVAMEVGPVQRYDTLDAVLEATRRLV